MATDMQIMILRYTPPRVSWLRQGNRPRRNDCTPKALSTSRTGRHSKLMSSEILYLLLMAGPRREVLHVRMPVGVEEVEVRVPEVVSASAPVHSGNEFENVWR